jgi:tetratricopeptide (TPR) repeat protein
MHELTPEKVNRKEAFGALEKILASEDFSASPQLSAFLTFAVKQTLNGQGPALKAYTIATEVLGRPPTFDPQNDPIVRVEATRLRRAIDRYYANHGAKDDLRIIMPRGGYSVTFNEVSKGPSNTYTQPLRQGSKEKSLLTVKPLAIIGLLFIASTAAATISWKNWPTVFSEASNTGAGTDAAAANEATTTRSLPNTSKPNNTPKLMNWKPRIAAFSIKTDATAAPFMHQIGDVLSRFDGIMVFDETAMVDQNAEDLYQLDGRAKSGNPDLIDIRLMHTASHRTAFVRTITLPKDEVALQELAKKIAILIGGRDGIVITDAMPAILGELDQPISPRVCISAANAAIRTQESNLTEKARACLDDLIKNATNSGILLSLSADLRRRENQGDLTKAESEAQLAIALDPRNVRALHVLSELVNTKNPGLALRLGDLAVELNPYDPVILRSQEQRLRAAGLIGRADKLQNEFFGAE